jgi:hypothetical protein
MGTPYVGLPNVVHSVFYAYTITIGSVEIGSFEKFSQRSTRTVERIREIMYSSGPKVVDMVWGGTDITLELSRVELYTESLIKLFGASATMGLEYIITPMNITESRTSPATTGTAVINMITFFNCVPSDYGKDISTDQARIIETMTVQASYVGATTVTAPPADPEGTEAPAT